MALDDLNPVQRAFIEKYLVKKGYFKDSKNKKIVSRYEDYDAAEKEFHALVARMPGPDLRVKTFVKSVAPALAAKNAGKFKDAKKLMENVLAQGDVLVQEITGEKQRTMQAAVDLRDPDGASQTERDEAEAKRREVRTAMNGDLPAPDDFTAAQTALDQLRLLLETHKANGVIRLKKQAIEQAAAALTDPTGTPTAQATRMAAERSAITTALAADLPTPDQLKTAQAALDRLKALHRDAGTLAAMATANPKTAAAASAALDAMDAGLGGAVASPSAIVDGKNKVAGLVLAFNAADNEVQTAKTMPDSNPTELAAKQQALLAARQKRADVTRDYFAAKELTDKLEQRQRLSDALNTGALSDTSPPPLNDDQKENFVAAFVADPAFGVQALDVVKASSDPSHIADVLPVLTENIKDGFSDGTTRAFPDTAEGKADAAKYAGNLLKMGDHVGGDYFDRMEDYINKGGPRTSKPFGDEPRDPAARALGRSKAMAEAYMMTGSTPSGRTSTRLNANSKKSQKALAHMLFNPDVVDLPNPALSKHMFETAQVFADPIKGQACADVIKNTSTPRNDAGKAMIAHALGKDDPSTVTRDDARLAVISAAFTPVDQGPVGSCFTTAPARRFREVSPGEAMKGFSDIVTKGTFTSADGLTVNAVKLDALPKSGNPARFQGNPVVSSWEYSVAGAAANSGNSREQKKLRKNLMSPDGLGKVKKIVGRKDWPAAKAALTTAITNAYLFQYDPSSKIVDSSDGSSSTGRFVIVPKSRFAGPSGTPITTKAAFIASMTGVAVNALKLTATDPEYQKVVDLISSDKFIDAVCPGKYKPWQMTSGGMELGPTKALFGGDPETTDMIAPLPESGTMPSEGARSKEVLAKLLQNIDGKTDKYLNIGTEGIHSFNALPGEPSMTALIGATPEETAQKIETTLVEPGARIASTALDADKAAALYDQMVRRAADAENDSAWQQLILKTANDHRPTADATPAAIEAAFNTAMKAYNDARVKFQVDYAQDNLRAKIARRRQDEQAAQGTAFDAAAFDAEAQTELTENKDKETKKFETYYETQTRSVVLTEIAQSIDIPEVLIADTNWGSSTDHTFFVMMPDPATGELRLFRKTEPGGTLRPAERKWIDTKWDMTE